MASTSYTDEVERATARAREKALARINAREAQKKDDDLFSKAVDVLWDVRVADDWDGKKKALGPHRVKHLEVIRKEYFSQGAIAKVTLTPTQDEKTLGGYVLSLHGDIKISKELHLHQRAPFATIVMVPISLKADVHWHDVRKHFRNVLQPYVSELLSRQAPSLSTFVKSDDNRDAVRWETFLPKTHSSIGIYSNKKQLYLAVNAHLGPNVAAEVTRYIESYNPTARQLGSLPQLQWARDVSSRNAKRILAEVTSVLIREELIRDTFEYVSDTLSVIDKYEEYPALLKPLFSLHYNDLHYDHRTDTLHIYHNVSGGHSTRGHFRQAPDLFIFSNVVEGLWRVVNGATSLRSEADRAGRPVAYPVFTNRDTDGQPFRKSKKVISISNSTLIPYQKFSTMAFSPLANDFTTLEHEQYRSELVFVP